MKLIKPLLASLTVAIAFLLVSCFHENQCKDVRIKSFLWENVLYRTEYTHGGLLKKLKATDRDITFYYDENKKLYKAEILFHGASAPESVFNYVQGPHGISRITWHRDDAIHLITDFTYSDDGTIIHIVNAFDGSTDPYGQHTLDLTYQGDNVSKLVNSINGNPFTQMRTESFDNKKNPFRMLAASVNNPAFFPVGYYVFFQVGDYNMPYISWLSENNPGDIIYETVSIGHTEIYPLSYNYTHNLVTRITWSPYFEPGIVKTFEFEYGIY